ncbi:polysaccharide biosynthesis/export family protein [Loktanella sp. R86503]|uniref:polysaccharide biosynthesis/export family protein n=1 Tax=Loktanella sp. R86503 TaxID=3093847 RepID=UPI0036DE6204
MFSSTKTAIFAVLRRMLKAGSFRLLSVFWLGTIALFSSVNFAAAQSALARYAISSGDALQLDILDDAEPPYPLVVGNSGDVQLPFLGSLSIAGLTLSDAHRHIFDAYVDGAIFLSPKLDLSVVNVRPISVLGDVQTPGFFDYHADMTSEQAIGLAGGLMRELGGEEARSLQRVALRGELAANEAAIVREAVAAERLRMQFAGRDRIDAAQIVLDAIDQPDAALIATLIAQDEDIIAAERAHFEADRDLITQAITDVGLQATLIEEQITAQVAQIASYDEELASVAKLQDQGLVALPTRNRLLREVSDEETSLLRLRTTLVSTQREMNQLKRELLNLDFQRAQNWRQEMADVGVAAAQLRETRASLLQRLALLEDWTRRSADTAEDTRIELMVRRRAPASGLRTFAVTETDPILPGDVLIVRLLRDTSSPDLLAEGTL